MQTVKVTDKDKAKTSKQEKDAPERKVFTKNFGSLVSVLSSTDLYSHFVPEDIITLTDFQEISSCTTPKQKAELLLTKMSATIDAGHTTSFYNMLNIMVNFGTIATKELSLQIRRSLSTTGQSVNGSTDSFKKENYFTTPDEASREFDAVLDDIAKELNDSNEVDLGKISYHLTNGQGVPLLSQEAKDRITACKTICEIFTVLQAHWNWCSHRLLLDIINVVNSPKAQEILEKFEKKINNTMKLKFIYSKFKELPVPQGYRKMTAIVDKDYSEITLQEWSEIELTIFQCLGLLQPPSVINESQYVEVVWYICTEAVDSLKSKALQHKDLKSFLFLQVDGVVIFNYTRKPPLSEEFSDSDDEYEDALEVLSPNDLPGHNSVLEKQLDSSGTDSAVSLNNQGNWHPEAVKNVYENFHMKLIKSLPMKDALFFEALKNQNLFSCDLEGKVKVQDTQVEMAALFLNNAIKPSLDIDKIKPLHKLLTVMADDEYIKSDLLKDLAAEIEKQIEERSLISMNSSRTTVDCFEESYFATPDEASKEFEAIIPQDDLEVLLQHHNLLPSKWILHFNHNNIYQAKDLKDSKGSIDIFKNMLHYCNMEKEKEDLKTLLGITDEILLSEKSSLKGEKNINKKQQFTEYLKMLGLTNKFPKKLKIKDARMLHHELLGNIKHTKQIEILPYLMLQKIFMFDSQSRNVLFKGRLNNTSIHLKVIEKIHPLDCLLVLLHCCDDFLCQEIFSRLSTCQMAIPILLPNPYDDSIVFPLWAMRSIIKSWKSYVTFKSNKCRITDYSVPVISFLRIGEFQYSKSKLINAVISNSNQHFFFNWECEGSTSKRLFVDGLGEMCCYFPSGEDDFYQDMLIFLNLHGNALNHMKQARFIKKISFIVFLLLDEDKISEEIKQFLKELFNIRKLILLFPKLRNDQSFKTEESLNGMHIIKMAGKPDIEIKSNIRNVILSELNSSNVSHHKKLTDCVAIAHKLQIVVDEDNEQCMEGKELAEEVMIKIKSVSSTAAKNTLLPIQGPKYWQEWATLNKESYRKLRQVNFKTVEKKKTEIRQNQYKLSKNPTKAFNIFLHNLLKHSDINRLYYLTWLKMFLDNYSQQVLPKLEADCQDANKTNKTVEKLKNKLEKCNEELVQASFGLEHLFREIGQIYEARMDSKLNVPKKLKDEVANYPKIIAELMDEGYPVELMDGDASHVPVTWVLAVINEIKSLYLQGHLSKMFVISVLGIQNTGKSTLLNTMFGLHFNVSAARCTRGAYFQLLPLHDALIKQTNCHYIMVVDTEGLYAPELYFKKETSAQMHDNELGTFVIGIADMTIINIYGLTPGDLTNILETAVHAFIRMKEVEMNLSCHFVHQNVPEIMAEQEGKFGRRRFEDKLDRMTRTAAENYHLEGKYSSFRDVIYFKNETDVTFFPGLLQGNPPMAPVNLGYSKKACSLKQKLISLLQTRRGNYCTFSDFQQRICKLWEAILRDKYIFSFKNTLTVMAYSELDKHLCHWSWTLRRKMLKLQTENANMMSNCEVSQVNMVMQHCLAKGFQILNSTYSELVKELNDFFDHSDKADILIQWKAQTEIRLHNMVAEHKVASEHHCEILKVNRERHVQMDEIQQTYRQQLYAAIVKLSSETTIAGKSHSQREKIFDKHWKQWLDKLNKVAKLELYTSEHTIDDSISDILQEIFSANNGRIIMQLRDIPLACRGNALNFLMNPKEHLTSTKPIMTLLKIGQIDEKDANFTTDTFLNEAGEKIKHAVNTLQDYDKSVIFDILMTLRISITHHNEKSNKNYKFSPDYSVDLAIVIASYAARKLKAMVNKLKIENDPIKSLTKLKPIFFRTFESQFTAASNDQTAADNLLALLAPSIREALIEILRIEIVEDIRCGPQFKGKRYFIAQILEDLAKEHNFDLYKTYLSNSAESFRYWAKVYVEQHCQAKLNGETKLTALAKVHLQTIIKDVTEATNDLKKEYSITNDDGSDAYTESYCEDPIGDSTNSNDDDDMNCIEMNQWLESFLEKLNKKLIINSQEVQQMIGTKKLKNLNLFTRRFITNLMEEKHTILDDLKNQDTDISKVTEWKNPPHLVLCNTLIGCTEQCPLCDEQCELTDPDHLRLGKVHFTETHRPQCLGKYVRVVDRSLVLDICTYSIESTKQFRKPNTDPGEFIPYRNYKEIFKDWLITNEKPRSGPIYWQWFCAEFNTEIVEWIDSSATSVPLSWKLLTKDDAISSLCELYGSKLNT